MPTDCSSCSSYVRRHWIRKRTIGPERLSVRDNQSRTNNIIESYHAALRRRIKVSHPNVYSFLGHLQQATTDQLHDVARIRNGLLIRRPKKKANMLNDKRIMACMSRYDSGAYCRMQFLSAVSHSMGAHRILAPYGRQRHSWYRVFHSRVFHSRVVHSRVVHSRLVHPCHLVPGCPLPRFPPPAISTVPTCPLPRFQSPPK